MNAKTVTAKAANTINRFAYTETVTDAVAAQRYKIQLHILIQLHTHTHIDTVFTSGLIVMSIAYSGRLETKQQQMRRDINQ